MRSALRTWRSSTGWARLVDAEDLSVAQQLVAAGEALAPLLRPGRWSWPSTGLGGCSASARAGARTAARSAGTSTARNCPARSAACCGPDAEQWALHLRGVGGVGKTMLIRYLASGRYAAERDEPAFPIARVDFDHMNPDYPVRRPVQLLLELADELALHTAAVDRADRALSRFRAMATSVHESLSSVREEHAGARCGTRRCWPRSTISPTRCGSSPRSLLILDTCEELAKADAGDPAAPAVSNTLAIIERIHDRAPDVRVLLAGRRPLPDARLPRGGARRAGSPPTRRRYLTTFAARRLPDELAALSSGSRRLWTRTRRRPR